jgi:hypothetical protein
MVARISLALFLLIVPAAAFAAGSVPVPEGSQATLFALGLLGVIVGRRASMRKPDDDPDQD